VKMVFFVYPLFVVCGFSLFVVILCLWFGVFFIFCLVFIFPVRGVFVFCLVATASCGMV